jgi:hypothetical protein
LPPLTRSARPFRDAPVSGHGQNNTKLMKAILAITLMPPRVMR